MKAEIYTDKLILRQYVGETEIDGKEVKLSTTLNSEPIVQIGNKQVVWSWNEFIKEAVRLIEEEDKDA